jgi:AbrB family looped-hinge helix DNA binding protein
MRLTSKGQVTVPVEVREKLGLLPNDEVEFKIVKEGALLRKSGRPSGRGRALIQHMRGRGTVRLTTDEILRLTRGED